MHPLQKIVPLPQSLKSQSNVYELKARLDWGAPALTIIDARDRNEFNNGHILGAISMPEDELVNRALASLELMRDIYVYGEVDEETVEVAAKLRKAGYANVSEIRGGLAAWKAAGYPIESWVSFRAA